MKTLFALVLLAALGVVVLKNRILESRLKEEEQIAQHQKAVLEQAEKKAADALSADQAALADVQKRLQAEKFRAQDFEERLRNNSDTFDHRPELKQLEVQIRDQDILLKDIQQQISTTKDHGLETKNVERSNESSLESQQKIYIQQIQSSLQFQERSLRAHKNELNRLQKRRVKTTETNNQIETLSQDIQNQQTQIDQSRQQIQNARLELKEKHQESNGKNRSIGEMINLDQQRLRKQFELEQNHKRDLIARLNQLRSIDTNQRNDGNQLSTQLKESLEKIKSLESEKSMLENALNAKSK